MTSLVACLTTGKGSWNAVSEVIMAENWDKIFLVTNKFGEEKFTAKKPFNFIVVDIDASSLVIRDAIIAQLKGKIVDTEVALNLTSGAGNEHMALLSALLKLGFGVRLVECIDGKVVLV